MPVSNLPNALLKIGLALAKHHIKNVIGDEALQEIATTVTDIGGEKVQAKVDSIFASKEGQKELLKAAKAADEKFKQECKDNDLLQLFSMDYGSLPSVQEAIGKLPETLDDEILRETLFTAFRNDAPRRISDEKINEGVNLYVECLQSALIPVKDFGFRIIHTALKEIGKDVKDIKADVEYLVEKAKASPQSAADSKNYARFLVPFPHNPDFVGRDEELSSLHEMLQQKQSIVGIRPTVLVGLGGIGKTQLAVEYAHAHRDDYPSGVFWLNAINPLLIEFSDLAEKLEMSDRDTPRDKAARKAWDYLDAHPDALVIFDNVLEPSELNQPFSPDLVPANLRCRTLFTTRQRDFPRTFQPFEVKVLPEVSAMRLLLRARSAVLEEHHPEWGWARIVCAYLGWLPLALELAAAYLGAYPEVSITGYLERLRTEGSLETVDASEVRAIDLPTRVEEILKAAAAGNLEIKHQVAVSATLQTQWKRLDDEDARLLFRAAGQFPEASWIPTPRLGLLTGIDSEAKAGRPSPLNVALKKLHAVSLIEELSDDRMRLHPLVHEFAARLSPPSFRLEMAEQIAAEFNDVMRLQAHMKRYGIDMVLENVRAGLVFCVDKPETETYFHIFNLERVLDRQANFLRDWDAKVRPTFFLQQLYNEALQLNLKELRARAEEELTRFDRPYLRERFKVSREAPELVRTLSIRGFWSHLALSADGRLAIIGNKVLDVATGNELHTLKKLASNVALSADGRLAVSNYFSNYYGELTVWDVTTNNELRTLLEYKLVNDVALSADGRLVISASKKKLTVFDIATGTELRTLEGDFKGLLDEVLCVAISTDGRLAVSGSSDTTLKVWNVVTGTELHTLQGHNDKVLCVAISADGQLAVSGSSDTTLKVWNVVTGTELRTLQGHSDEVHDVALSANGQLAVSLSDTSLKVWDISAALPSLCNTSVNSDNGQQSNKSLFSPDAGKRDSAGILLDDELYEIQGHSNAVNAVALSADGKLAISASQDRTLKVWDVATGRELHTLQGHIYSVHSVALSADGQLAVSIAGDGNRENSRLVELKVWDMVTGCKLRTLEWYGTRISLSCIALSADGQLAVSGSGDFTLTVWEVVTGRELCKFKGHSNQVNSVALSADGRLAVSAECQYSKLTVWDVATGRELHKLKGHSLGENVNGVALSADGRLAVSASSDKTLKVWDVATGNELRTLQGHNDKVLDVALCAVERLAVSVSDDKTLKVWDLATGLVISTFSTNTALRCCAMKLGGKTIIAGDSLGGVHFLELAGAGQIQVSENWIDILIEESKIKAQVQEKFEARSSRLPRWLKGLLGRK